MKARSIALLMLAALNFFGCGAARDLFGSRSAVPVSGVATWGKIDLDPDRDLTQPYVLFGDYTHRLVEPHYMKVGETHWLYWEEVELDPQNLAPIGSAIYYATGPTGIDWGIANDNEAVLVADQPWEGDRVGAPCIVKRDGQYFMWYAGGEGAGIGLAVSDDGVHWIKHEGNPVLVADQEWEGDVVGAPSVIFHNKKYRLYYSGGVVDGPEPAQAAGNAIGYAESSDGITWRKRDANGHDSNADTPDVEPILLPSQGWEGLGEEEGQDGWVSSPFVRVDHPADRDVYRMYYTGNLRGEPVLIDVSIGYAGSYDGLDWVPAIEGTNPILAEKFPLSLPGITNYMLYGEFSPSVIRDGDQFRMIFAQTDPLDALHGLAIAKQPSGL